MISPKKFSLGNKPAVTGMRAICRAVTTALDLVNSGERALGATTRVEVGENPRSREQNLNAGSSVLFLRIKLCCDPRFLLTLASVTWTHPPVRVTVVAHPSTTISSSAVVGPYN